MAVHPNSPNPNNANNANNANNNHFQALPAIPRAPNPNNGVMAAPNFNRPGGFGPGAFARNLGLGPRQMYIPRQPHQAQHIAQRAAAANLQFIDDDEEHEDAGPILIKIHCPVIIKGDNNVCAIDPATITQRIAMAVANSLRTMGNGVPMINENGEPREIRVDVHAETRIDGNRNLVGERYNHVVLKAENEEVVAVENGDAHAHAAIANGNGGGSGGKRKLQQVEQEEQDVASAGLRIKLEPLDDEEEEDLGVKRPRRG